MKVWRTVALVCTPLLFAVAWLGVELASSPSEPMLGGAIHVVASTPGPTPDVPMAEDPGDITGAVAVPPTESCLAGDDTDDGHEELEDELDDTPDLGDCED